MAIRFISVYEEGDYIVREKKVEPNIWKEKDRYVRPKEGADIYRMCTKKFVKLAYDAGAVLKIERLILVDRKSFEEYLRTFVVK